MVASRRQGDVKNLLLKNMKREVFNNIEPYLNYMSLRQNFSIEKHDKAIERVYFPEFGAISIVAGTPAKTSSEIGLIGYEGMTGTSLLYGVNSTPNDTYVQISGDFISISSDYLQSKIRNIEGLRDYFLKYAFALMMQTSNTSMCNARFNIKQRLARWLLMGHDRVLGDEIMLQHEFLGVMLGIRRAGVTVALKHFVDMGAIINRRAMIVVRSRKLLIDEAGHSYGIAEQAYTDIMKVYFDPPAAKSA